MKATGTSRIDRVATQVHRELADILGRDYDDPRIRALTVADVQVSKDLRNARVYVTVAHGAPVEASLAAVRRAAGDVRRRLGARVRMKYLPQLRFEFDPTLERAFALDKLIAAGLPEDAEPDAGEDAKTPPRQQ